MHRLPATALLLVAVIAVSGCTSTDLSGLVKALPEVQQFLKDNPNADVRAALWPQVEVDKNIDTIRADCHAPVESAAMYRVDIKDTDLDVTLWLDATTRQPVCVIKRAGEASAPPSAGGPPPRAHSGDWFLVGQKRTVEVDDMLFDVTVTSIDGQQSATIFVNNQEQKVDRLSSSFFYQNPYAGGIEGVDVRVAALGEDRVQLMFTAAEAPAKEAPPTPVLASGSWFPEGELAGVYTDDGLYHEVFVGVTSSETAVVQVNGLAKPMARGASADFPNTAYDPQRGVTVRVEELRYHEPGKNGQPATPGAAKLVFTSYDRSPVPAPTGDDWFSESQTRSVTINGKSYVVMIGGVSSSTNAVITVNGETRSVIKGETYTIQGLDVYVDDLYYVSKQGQTSKAKLLFPPSGDDWFSEGAAARIVVIKGKSYTIALGGVSSSTVAVITVNGETRVVTKGETYTIQGLTLKVEDVYYLSKQGQSSKVKLTFSAS